MDWSKIITSGQLTEKILEQAASIREDAYALLDRIQKFDEPFNVENRLVRLFVLIAKQSWIGNRLVIEIAFKDVEHGRLSYDCEIRLLVPIGDGSYEQLKKIAVKASNLTFRELMRDKRKLSPFMLEDGVKGKYVLKAERAMSLPPPEVAQSRQKIEALFARQNKPMTIPPAMKKALESSRRKPDPAPAMVGKPTESAKPTPPARAPSLGSDKRKQTRTYFDVSSCAPEQPQKTLDLDQDWGGAPPPPLAKPPKPRT
ncbi:MAG: hypothetical protein WCW31_05195 [Patescibacteria group bacterium]|jgi:hypothetical protein